jgi:hypothetical protein
MDEKRKYWWPSSGDHPVTDSDLFRDLDDDRLICIEPQ